ncbi:ATP-binding protein [Steroidobacter agaridevorans]|uniref:ATP-binding protein n=1 Tax=Steroidobacter agaridevorans TaxID=2695856 RepID=UPI00192A3C3D
MLLEPSGVGTGHLAMALDYRAVMAGTKTRFMTAADLMIQLAAAKAQDRLKGHQSAVPASSCSWSVRSEYVPFGRDEAALFLNVACNTTKAAP